MRIVMSEAELEHYAGLLSGAKSVVEYGAGGSTVTTVTATTATIFSVESDAGWIARLRQESAVLEAEQTGRLILHYVDIGPVEKMGRPSDVAARDRWPNYAAAPWHGDRKADVVLVDGRFRVACALRAVLSSEPKTMIAIHDFWNRPKYHPALPFLEWVSSVNSLGVFRPRSRFDRTALMELLERYQFDPD